MWAQYQPDYFTDYFLGGVGVVPPAPEPEPDAYMSAGGPMPGRRRRKRVLDPGLFVPARERVRIVRGEPDADAITPPVIPAGRAARPAVVRRGHGGGEAGTADPQTLPAGWLAPILLRGGVPVAAVPVMAPFVVVPDPDLEAALVAAQREAEEEAFMLILALALE